MPNPTLPKESRTPISLKALWPALDDMRARATWRLSWVRVVAGGALLLVALATGTAAPQSGWLACAPVLAVYFFAGLALTWSQRSPRMRGVAATVFPFLDIACAFALQLRFAPIEGQHANELSLAVFVLVVLLSVFTLRPGIVWATALASFACEYAVHAAVGSTSGPLAAGAVLAASGWLGAWTSARMREGVQRLVEEQAQGKKASELSEELVARLVNEEVQSRLANERSEELARANNHIAQVNAILKDQHRKLQLAQREAEKLTALLVHDMKGPLSSVLGFVELVAMHLGARPEAQGQVKHLRTALDQGRRLLDMIESLLAIARLERGAVTAKREDTALLPLLQTVVNAQAARAETQKVLIGAQAEPDVHAAFDRELIQRLLENLIGNALTYSKAGDRVELAAMLERGDLVLAVRNSGQPIPDELRGSLFQRFVTSAKPGRGNVGLGLYFCRLVAEAHQGTIQLEDAPGWSVSFVVRIPAGITGVVSLPLLTPVSIPKDSRVAKA